LSFAEAYGETIRAALRPLTSIHHCDELFTIVMIACAVKYALLLGPAEQAHISISTDSDETPPTHVGVPVPFIQIS
jgi:hypothetical protein